VAQRILATGGDPAAEFDAPAPAGGRLLLGRGGYGAPRDARRSAPRPAPLLPLRRDAAAVAAWRGGALTPPRLGGGRAALPAPGPVYVGGGHAPALGHAPPLLCTSDGGGGRAAGKRPAPDASHCRAVQRGSVRLLARVALPAHRDAAAAAARFMGG